MFSMADAPMVLSNGTLKDPKTGRFLPGVRPSTAITSSERARDLAKLGVQARVRKARRRAAEAAEEHTGKVGLKPSDVYAEIAGEFTRSALANAMDKPRDAAVAAKLSLRLQDMLPDERAAASVVVPGSLSVSGEGLAFLRQLVATAAGQLVEGVVVEVGEQD